MREILGLSWSTNVDLASLSPSLAMTILRDITFNSPKLTNMFKQND